MAPITDVDDIPSEHGENLFSLLKEDVMCVFDRDPAARNVFDVLTCYPGIHALIIYRIAHAAWHRGLRWPARFLSYLARAITNIDIHPGAEIGRRFFIDHGACVVIGETAIVGDDCTLYHGVTLGGTSWNKGRRHPTLGDGVLVGAGAKILGPITVGRNCRVGANSVVTKDVPDGMTVVGIPGRIVRPPKGEVEPHHGIDLEHHLMPDPVGKAIACLIDHINRIEKRLETHAAEEARAVDLLREHIADTLADTIAGALAQNGTAQNGTAQNGAAQNGTTPGYDFANLDLTGIVCSSCGNVCAIDGCGEKHGGESGTDQDLVDMTDENMRA